MIHFSVELTDGSKSLISDILGWPSEIASFGVDSEIFGIAYFVSSTGALLALSFFVCSSFLAGTAFFS